MNNDQETTEIIKQAVKTVVILGAAFLAGVIVLVLIGIAKNNLQ
jgi:hypothetical protein